MSSSPIKATTLDKIIKAAATVKTKSGLAALTLVLLFLCFFFALLLTKELLQWVLSILTLACLIGFAFFAVITTREDKPETKRGRGEK
ncbi:MAG: hypothetical protein ABIH70_02965 [Chloroflexota bacterium]